MTRLPENAQDKMNDTPPSLLGLYQMGQTVLTSLELNVVLKQVIDQLLLLLGARDASILLLENDSLVFAAVAGLNAGVLQGQRIPADAGIAGQVLRSGRPLRVSGQSARDGLYQPIQELTAFHTQTLLAAPLMAGGQAIGLVEAVHSEPDAFTDQDLALLEAAAIWAAIAIDNARQHQDLRRQLQESQAMAAITQALTETLDLERNFQLIVDTAQQMIPQVERAVIHLLEEKHQALRPVAVAGAAERGKPGFAMHPGEGIAGRVMAEGIVLSVPDIAADPRYLSIGPDPRLRSLLVAPVQSGGQRLGTLSVASAAPNAFTVHDERLLAHLGAQAAIAIDKARLYQAEREQRRLAEALRDTAAALSRTLDRDELLKTIVAVVSEIAHYPTVRLFFVEKEGLQQMAQYGDSSAEPPGLVPVGHELALHVIQTHAPLLASVTRSGHADPSSSGFLSAMGVPVDYGGETRGVLLVETRPGQPLNQDDLDWLEGVGQQLGVALENARLYADLQNALQQEKSTREQLVQADKLAAIGQMAASVAHELNNPLQAIQGCLDLAETWPSDPAKQQHYLVMARAELDRLAAIVRRMLDYYRPAKGTREEADLCGLMEDVLALSGKRLSHGKVTVETELDESLPTVRVVSNQIKQVFLNIVLNAVEAMPQGGCLKIRGAPAQDADGRAGVAVSFQDTGGGIRPEDQQKIFEPFYTTRATGTGLGLAVTHNIVSQHQGRLTVESAMGQGSTFTVWLPL